MPDDTKTLIEAGRMARKVDAQVMALRSAAVTLGNCIVGEQPTIVGNALDGLLQIADLMEEAVTKYRDTI